MIEKSMQLYLLPVSPDAIQALERQVDVLSEWLIFWTGLVVLGLMMEYGSDFAKWKPRNLKNPRSFIWVPIWGIMGGVLVVGGVAGEMYVGFSASRVESRLRDANHQNEAWLTKEAGDAATSAKTAHDEVGAVKEETDELTTRLGNAAKQLGILEQDVVAQGP